MKSSVSQKVSPVGLDSLKQQELTMIPSVRHLGLVHATSKKLENAHWQFAMHTIPFHQFSLSIISIHIAGR